MSNALQVQFIVKPAAGMTASFGPREVMAELAAGIAGIGGGYTVYTDGAENKLVAIPANEAVPNAFT